SLTWPRGTHVRYAPACPSVTEDKRNRTIGTARAVATSPLKRIPNFMNNPRREILFSFGIFRLLMLGVIRSRVCPPRVLNPPRGEPGNYVGDFLIRHRFSRHISTPIGRAQFRTPGDHNRAQALIADERKKRIIRDSAALGSTTSTRTVARLAVGLIGDFA